jgi:hypothetical protein
MSFRFQNGRVSCTPYAVLSASMSALKMLAPDQSASRAPTDITPGAPGASTTSRTTCSTIPNASAGTAVRIWLRIIVNVRSLFPNRPEHRRQEEQEREEREKEVVRCLRGQAEDVVFSTSRPVALTSGTTRYPRTVMPPPW